jgi:hypothetical protein
MGKGSRGKKYFQIRRKMREKRRTMGETGPAYTPSFEEKFKKKAKYNESIHENGGEKDSTFYTDLGKKVSLKTINYMTREERGKYPK